VAERKDVKSVPGQALRFEPSGVSGDGNGDAQRVFVLRGGEPVAVPVSTGLDDGNRVEITGGELTEGDAVIVDQSGAAAAARGGPGARSSPFRF
jgi:HlyD family secretion protein